MGSMDDDLPKFARGPRKIYRSRTDRMVFGVCGGIADYYNIESLWVRLIFIFLGLTGAIGLLLYLALAFLMPLDPAGRASQNINMRETAEKMKRGASQLAAELSIDPQTARRRNLLGFLIVAVGVVAFFNVLFPNLPLGWNILWPIAIILIGFSLLE